MVTEISSIFSRRTIIFFQAIFLSLQKKKRFCWTTIYKKCLICCISLCSMFRLRDVFYFENWIGSTLPDFLFSSFALCKLRLRV